MKSVLISIQPKWCELIARGEKTVEVRKTRPKIDTPFKVYIYCTKAKEHFSLGGGVYATSDTLYRLPTGEIKFGDGFELMGDWSGQYDENNFLNGKVIGEFVCDCITALKADNIIQAYYNNTKDTCLSDAEITIYANGKKVYYWHISNLVIYDKPKELGDFYHFCGANPECEGCEVHYYNSTECGAEDYCCSVVEGCKPLTRPPQSWCYVEKGGDGDE